MTREWPSVGLLPTEKGKQFFSSAPPHKFHTVMKHVVVWNIALRLTVTQLISVLVPSLRLYSSTKIWCGIQMEILSFKIFFYFVRKTTCAHTYISVFCRLLGKRTLQEKRGISERDWNVYIPARKLKVSACLPKCIKIQHQPCTFRLGVGCQWVAPKPVLRRQVKGGSTMVYRQMAPPSLFSVPLCEYIGTRVKMCTTQWCAVNELNTTQTV